MANINREESSIGINYFEYNVEKKTDAKTKLERAGIVLVDIILLVLVFAFVPSELLLIAFCGFAMIFAILTYFLYKRTQIEYEYIVNSGDFSMNKIYGGRSRKELFNLKVSAFHTIAPYSEEAIKRESNGTEMKIYTCISSPDAMDIYYATFIQEEKKCAVIFECPKKALASLRFYNSKAIQK